jgi:hypothetical protein
MLLSIPDILTAAEVRAGPRTAGRRALAETAAPAPATRPYWSSTTSSCRMTARRRAHPRHGAARVGSAAAVFEAALPASVCSRRALTATAVRPTTTASMSTTRSATETAASACAPTCRARCSCPIPATTTGASWSFVTPLEDAGSQAACRATPCCTRHQRAPGVAGYTRGARAGLLLLDRKHGAQRRAAPPAVRHGHGADATAPASTATALPLPP